MAETKARILIVAHGHPEVSKGGAEIAAYHLYRELDARDNCDALFLARAEGTGHGGTPFALRNSDREIMFHASMNDYFLFRAENPHAIWTEFRQLLRSFRPTVVHFQHYTHMGLEMIREARNSVPETRILLTLHEYLAICNNQGQMIRTSDGALCYRAHPADCHRCFPERSPGDFFMRERYIKSFLNLIDVFIAPSQFLSERYVEWGLPADRIMLIENGLPSATPAAPRPLAEAEPRCRFAFFGQINPFKGVDVLLDALGHLGEAAQKSIRVDIHGGGLTAQPADYQSRIELLRARTKHIAMFHGPYQSCELPSLMADTDWVVVPSIWWENSPVVIQEAFQHRRPVICADIGGLAEKVTHGEDGLHFRCGDARDLARAFDRAIMEHGLWDELVQGIRAPQSVERTAEMHWRHYVSDSRPALTAHRA